MVLTFKKWYSFLPDPYRKEAIKEYKGSLRNNAELLHTLNQGQFKFKSIKDGVLFCIIHGFEWSTSVQGYDYWSDVYRSITNDEVKLVNNFYWRKKN